MRLNFVIPPLVELHSPYPSTAYLMGYFKDDESLKLQQADLGIQFFHKVFSEDGLARIQRYLLSSKSALKAPSVQTFLSHFPEYQGHITTVMDFLTGRDRSLATRLAKRGYLPERIVTDKTWFYERHILSGQLAKVFPQETISKSTLANIDPLLFSFGDLGVHDRARYLTTLFLKDIIQAIQDGIDPEFTLTDFGDKLCDGAYSFEPIYKKLESKPTVLDEMLDELTSKWFAQNPAEVIGITVPHPGTMYGALRIARTIKRLSPETYIVAGGGYINGQLRTLEDPCVFDYFDFLTLDRGYKPLESILKFIRGEVDESHLHNTLVLENDSVSIKTSPHVKEVHHKQMKAPDYTGIQMDQYLSPIDILAPVESLWNSIKWNRMNLTYGCYWAKCTFCPVKLDYIGNFESAEVDFIISHIKSVIQITGSRGFYFVDKAMPPKLLKALCERILEEKLNITWWGYVRFDRSFTAELATLMAKAGCITVLAGLESGSDRNLKFMDKGTNIREITEVSHNFSKAGILVHGYLIYGYPNESHFEILNTLEFARQLFRAGCLASVSASKLILTQNSLLAATPEKYGVSLKPQAKGPKFATFMREWEYIDGRSNVWFTDTICINGLGRGLINATLRYNHGVGLDQDIRTWFYGLELPKPTLSETFVEDTIRALATKSEAKLGLGTGRSSNHSSAGLSSPRA